MTLDFTDWKHKPGLSVPLKYLYANVWEKDWTNEGIEYGSYTVGNLIYNSDIYYFRPKTAHSLSDSYTYTGGHYHSGTFHFYEVQRLCAWCEGYVDSVIKQPCSGPPCSISFASIGNIYEE